MKEKKKKNKSLFFASLFTSIKILLYYRCSCFLLCTSKIVYRTLSVSQHFLHWCNVIRISSMYTRMRNPILRIIRNLFSSSWGQNERSWCEKETEKMKQTPRRINREKWNDRMQCSQILVYCFDKICHDTQTQRIHIREPEPQN